MSTVLTSAPFWSLIAHTVRLVVEVDWARTQAGQLLRPLGSRWLHTVAVAHQAERLVHAFAAREADQLVAAAYLHDVGYAPALLITGCHPIDGAAWLDGLLEPEVVALVAHHSCAWVEAELRGLSAHLEELPRPRKEVLDALTYCDMTSGPEGHEVTVDERIDEVIRRYGRGHVVSRSIEVAAGYLRDAVARAQDRAAQLHASAARL